MRDHMARSLQSSSAAMTHLRETRVSRPVRLAAILLLLVWVGPVTFVETDSYQLLRWIGAPERAAADTRVIPAGGALLLEPWTLVKLRLRDGGVLKGRFL